MHILDVLESPDCQDRLAFFSAVQDRTYSVGRTEQEARDDHLARHGVPPDPAVTWLVKMRPSMRDMLDDNPSPVFTRDNVVAMY